MALGKPAPDLSGPSPLADEPPWPSAGRAWFVVGVLLIAYTFSFADRMILSLLIAPIRQAFEISDFQASLLLGLAFSLFYTAMGIPCAMIADRANRRTLITVGIILWSVMTALSAVAQDFGSLFVARIGVGIGEAALLPAAYSMLADLFPKHRLGRAMAVFTIGAPLGGGLALIGGGVIVSFVSELPPIPTPWLGSIEGWRLAFVCVGAPGLLVALLLRLTVAEPRRRGSTVHNPGEGAAALEVFRFVLNRWKAFGALYIGLSSMAMVLYGFLAWAPTFFSRAHGVPASEAAVPFGILFAVFGSAGLVLGGGAVDALVKRGFGDAHVLVLAGSVALSAVFCTAAPLASAPAWSLLLFAPVFLLGMVHGAVLPTALQLMAPNHLRAQVSALYYVFQNLLGLGAGPTIIAMLAEQVFEGPRALGHAMALLAGCLLPLAALLIWIARRPVRAAMDAVQDTAPADLIIRSTGTRPPPVSGRPHPLR